MGPPIGSFHDLFAVRFFLNIFLGVLKSNMLALIIKSKKIHHQIHQMHPKCGHLQEHQARVAASATVTDSEADGKNSLTSMDSGKLGAHWCMVSGGLSMDGSDFSDSDTQTAYKL